MAEVLESSHRASILLFLLRNGPRTKGEIYTGLKINPTYFLKNGLPGLVDSGLVQVKTEHRGLRKSETHVVSLTIFGKKVAEQLNQIDGTIHEAQKHATPEVASTGHGSRAQKQGGAPIPNSGGG
jgi:predicted transcriptional regulator